MADELPLFHFDPAPVPDSMFGDEPGVVPAYLYLWSGQPGPAQVVRMVAIVGDEGEVLLEQTGDIEPCEVVDTRTADPGS